MLQIASPQSEEGGVLVDGVIALQRASVASEMLINFLL